MDRVQLNIGGTLSAYWEVDGVPHDPGVVTVTITRSDGTVLVTNGAAIGTGTSRTYLLTPAQAATLDYLTLTWASSTDSSTLTTYAEVVGGFLFTVAQARARSPLQDVTAYPLASVLYYRNLAEQALEDITGVAFTPRFLKETVDIVTYGVLEGSRRRIRNVRQITTWNGTTDLPLSTLNGLQIVNHGAQIFMPIAWNWTSLPIKMSYEHGYNQVPPRVSRACLELARRWLVESPWDERMTGFRSREGGSMQILTATGSPFDLPEVVAVAEQYGSPMIQ